MLNIRRPVCSQKDPRGANNLGSRGLAWRTDRRSDAAPEVDRLRNRSLSHGGQRQPERHRCYEDESLDEIPPYCVQLPALFRHPHAARTAVPAFLPLRFL